MSAYKRNHVNQDQNPVRSFMKKFYRKRPWNRAVTFVAGTIVFVTTYMLILPAITMTKNPVCGLEEHTHTDACYTVDYVDVLDCPYSDAALEQAYGGSADGLALNDDVVLVEERNEALPIILHTHDERCYDRDGQLICPLQERQAHIHTEECYLPETDFPQEIPAEDTAPVQDSLIFTAGGLDTGMPVQEFGDAAVPTGETLFSDDSVSGGLLSAEPQPADPSAGNVLSVDTSVYDPSFSGDHTERIPVCGKEELIPHVHSESCYDASGMLVCPLPVVIEHQHTDECFHLTESEPYLTCGMTEHVHDDSCYAGQDEDGGRQPQTEEVSPSDVVIGGEEGKDGPSENTDGDDNISGGIVVIDSDSKDGTEDSSVDDVEPENGQGGDDPNVSGEDSFSGEDNLIVIGQETEIISEVTTESGTEVHTDAEDADIQTSDYMSQVSPVTEAEDSGEVSQAAEADYTVEIISEAASEQSTKMSSEITSEITSETAPETVSESDYKAEVVTEEVYGAGKEAETEDVAEKTSEEISEIVSEISVEMVSEAVLKETSSAAETALEDVSEVTTEITSEAVSEVSTELASEAVSEVFTEMTSEAVSEGFTEITSEAVSEASTEVTTEFTEAASYAMDEEEPHIIECHESDYTVRISYGKKAEIPAHSTVSAKEILPGSPEYAGYVAEARKALSLDEETSLPPAYARFFDITILSTDGKEVQPADKVKVEIIYDKPIAEAEDAQENLNANVVHFAEDGKTEVISDVNSTDEAADMADSGSAEGDGFFGTEEAEVADGGDGEGGFVSEEDTAAVKEQDIFESDNTGIKAEETAVESEKTNSESGDVENQGDSYEQSVEAAAVSFSADSFSVYGVIYTVDFHWEVDGKTYEFSIPGGGFVSLEHLVEVLGIGVSDTNDNSDDAAEADTTENETDELFDSAEKVQESCDTNDEAIKLNEVEVSETTKKFVADVESVGFSTPSLVDVSKVESMTTVGQIKEIRGLECKYSAELTEEQIAEINAQTVEAGNWALISVQPFTSEETLTVTMKDGEAFTIRVTDAQIKKTVIDAKGDTWEITVTYGEDAKIPDNAKLNVKEILSIDEEYTTLLNSAAVEACSDAEKQGIDMPVFSGARLFDIEIQGEDGKIEPAAPVLVSIRLAGTAAADHTSVIHFEEDGAKALMAQTSEIQMFEMRKSEDEASDEATSEETVSDTQESTEKEADEKAVTEISFRTESFSVYSVVNVSDMSSIVNSGKKYALVSGIANDPGDTTGYNETWGQDYFTIIVNAHAVSDQPSYDDQNRVEGLRVEPVHAYEDGSISYVGGDPAQWQFESAENGKYYLIVNGKYLQRYNKGDNNSQYGWEARLVDNKNNATKLNITVNSDGTICIYDDIGGNQQQYYLHNEGNGEWAGRYYRFTNQNVNVNSSAYRFRLCTESDRFDSFAARKISVQNLTVNDNFLIYRKFEDSQGNEQLYALASDGTFVRVYDGGDTVYWRETDKNLYWNYRLEGSYYSIYSTNPSTNATVYINPLDSSDPPQLFTNEPSRLTLIGKDNGEYGTTIENWDQTAYDYAGLHVTVDSQSGPSLSTGIHAEGTSDTFLFAVAASMPGATAEPVATVDSDSLGIKITMFDYGEAKGNYNAGDKLNEMTNIAGSAEYTPHEAHALVKPYLESGLPSSTTKGVMTGLFTTTGSAVTAYSENVNHLFLQSYYDENGMFRYRSEDNYAYLPYDPDTETITGTDFTVYRQAATPYPDDVSPGHTYYTHGHFMPYNDIDMNQNISRLMNQYGNAYDPDDGEIVGELPVGDGRTYEDIYGVQGIPNFYTGMKMESDFTQLKDGKCENGDPMVFKFTGDDDMWVYIDGVLVLDIGGIHEPLSGAIDFSTGQVVNPDGSSLAGTKNLKTIFMDTLHALQNIPSDQRTQEQNDLIARIQSIEWKGNTFADYTNHDFKAFYMERGAGASNLDIQFNLKVVRADEFVVEKQITDGVDKRFVNQEYKFKATFKDYKDNDKVKPLFANQKDKYDEYVCTGVYYRDRKDDEGNPVAVNVDEDGYFTLNVGEAAIFKMADRKIEYSVSEVEINPGLTRQVEVNGKVVTVSNEAAEVAYARVSNRSQLNYKNHPFLQNLNIIKHLLPQNTQARAGDVFEFRVYLETVLDQEGEMVHQLVPYSFGPYYITRVVGGQTHYYTLNGENNAPRDQGTTPVVCSTTGRSGSINSIPPEYTVVIPNLAVGTHFYIEERRDNIPVGYIFDHEDLLDNTYDAQTLGSNEDIITRILARDEKDHQTFDPDTIGKIKKDVDAQTEVFNKKVYVNVQKQWLKTNGQPYTLAQARQLPDSTKAVVTAELWRKKNTQETIGEADTPVTITFMVNTTENSEYRQVSVPITIKNNSTLEFSLGANKTSQAKEIHTDPAYSVSRTSVTSDQKITYSNGRKKDKWSKYTISGITKDTTVYATFDAAKVSDDFVGLYIAAMEEPNSSTAAPAEEKVADITLSNGNDWSQQVSMEQGYTYFLMNVIETGLVGHEHEYTFIDAPTVSTDANGNLILAVANKYREPAQITVEKIWSPPLTSEEEANAHVTVELHRYAKKSKGLFEVVLKDNYGAPIGGAQFRLYKDGVVQEQEYVTDVNGKVTADNLEPGSYVFKQINTPEGYSMPDPAPQTESFVVEDNTTRQQHMHCELQNQALETNGVAVLILLDNKGAPVQGAKYNLIKKENNSDVIVTEGLETDENGHITVSQLGAGTYYFYETEPPADYNLPNDWQDTDFTVVEHPGIVQRFNISMVNNLKGKGYVNVNLIGPEGRKVSGATFELYKDNEKVTEKDTDDSGQLTFGNPDKLSAGTYYVKQVTTDSDLLPASQQSFTIYDNGNANQPNELSFTNLYKGKGSVTVTLTRKDNNNPISGAAFELYKDGEKIGEKTTNDSGQLTFGYPDKLPAGNYSIKQTSTAEGLQPVVNNWPFQILENGDPNQTKSWNVQNEDEAGNVTIKLWKKQGLGQYNWTQVGDAYVNLKPGKTYNFTAELNPGLYPSHCWYLLDETENNNYRNLQANELTGISQSGTWDSSNNTYHFSITPTKDNTTYSYVLATDWGSNDIKSMTMDESSRRTAAFSTSRPRSQQAKKLAASKARLQESADAPDQKAQGDQNEGVQNNTLTTDNENVAAPGKTRNGSTLRDVPTVVYPSDPPNDEYIVDSGFKETYTITKSDNNWKHVFENLDKCDQDENPYYYYVVETECVPEYYHVTAYDNDNLTDTGTIKITNQKEQKGSLSVTKSAKGLDPEDASGKTYQIGVKDASGNYYKLTGDIAEQSPFYVTFNGNETKKWNELPAGTYTVEEENADVSGYTWSVTGTDNVNVPEGGSASATIINTYTKIIMTLDILKVQKDTEIPIENATFKLWKIDGESSILSKYDATEKTVTTNAHGKASFGNLTVGYYIVTETDPPTGYVITCDDSFYVEITDNGINLLVKGDGAPSTWTKNATSYGIVKTFTAATANSNAQATVENTPGAALPNTGGPGTTMIYLFGTILTSLACAGLVMSRKRRAA